MTYVIPVSLTLLQRVARELERAAPGAGLGRAAVFGQGQLAAVVVPVAEQMDGLTTGGGAEREGKLDCGHIEGCLWWGDYEVVGDYVYVVKETVFLDGLDGCQMNDPDPTVYS